MTEEHRELRELLGAYVLGQLAAGERAGVEQHLADCADCRAELTGLAPVATALRGLDPNLPAAPAPPPELGEAVLDRISRHRRLAGRRQRVRRGVAGLLVAASVAAAFATGAWYAGPRNEPPVVGVALQVTAPGVDADAGLVRHTWGTELRLTATGLTDGADYAVVFVRDDGSRVPGGTFLGTGDRPLHCSMNAALPVEQASAVTITDAAGAVVMQARI